MECFQAAVGCYLGDWQSEREEEFMLGDSPIHPVLLSTDLAETRRFYHDQIGLEIMSESEEAIVFRCGGGTHLTVTKSTTGTADTDSSRLGGAGCAG